MRLEDYDGYEQDRLDREDAAEHARVQREAARAFHQVAPRRVPRLSGERRAQVALAAAAIAALGTDGYAHAYTIGGAR